MNIFKDNYLPFLLLFIQPIFMASNLIVARGGIEFVPPISLAFWRWAIVFMILLPFTYLPLKQNFKILVKEYKKLFFLGAMGCGVCGAFPFLAGETTTVTNMGIIYTSSPIFIILISAIFFREKISLTKMIGLTSCLLGVLLIIIKGDLDLLLNLNFTIGDIWMLAASIGWALYSVYLFYWKSNLPIFQRFTLVAFFSQLLELKPFYFFGSMTNLSLAIKEFTIIYFIQSQFGSVILGQFMFYKKTFFDSVSLIKKVLGDIYISNMNNLIIKKKISTESFYSFLFFQLLYH